MRLRLTDNLFEGFDSVGIMNRGGMADWELPLEVGIAAKGLGPGWVACGDCASHEFTTGGDVLA